MRGGNEPPADRSAGHQLAISIPTEPLILEVDAVRVARVIANLLNNAAKYTDPAGKSGSRRGGAGGGDPIRDNGIGIAPEKLPHVFEMFAQIQSADSS